MTHKTEVENYLREEPKFRERRNKDRGIVNLLIKRMWQLGEGSANTHYKEHLIAFAQEYASMDRVWRQALERNPELRGSDYGERVALVQKKQQELGYNVSHTH